MSKPAGAACAECPARDAKCVLPEPAKGRARLAIVGEAPGRHELEQGRPFIGASGRMLARGLRTLGLTRGSIHWTNAILCECDLEDQRAARKACAGRLQRELAQVAPPVIMPVGAWGLQSTLGLGRKPRILRWRGSVTRQRLADDGPEALVCPTLHPAFVMRSPKWGPILELDVARVGRVMLDGWTAPEDQPGRVITIPKQPDELAAALGRLRPAAPIGFDVETVGLGPTETALVCFAVSDGRLTVVVPWASDNAGRGAHWARPPEIAAMVTKAMASRVTVTHNGPAFDHIVGQRYGIRVSEWDDTLLAAHAVQGHLPKRLAHVVSTRLDVAPWKEYEDRNADLDRLWIYNARDTLYTILVWQELQKELAA